MNRSKRGLLHSLRHVAAGAAAAAIAAAITVAAPGQPAGPPQPPRPKHADAPAAPAARAISPAPAPAPFATEPLPWPDSTLVPPPQRPYLPPARGGDIRRRGEAARQKPLRLRPVTDLPPLAVALDSIRPRISPPSAPAVRVAPPGRTGLAALWRLTGPDGDRARLSTDPTLAQSAQAAVTAVPQLRTTPAPFARLKIPNPFELSEDVRLQSAPPDDEPPAAPAKAPPAPKLPVSAKP